MNKSPNRFNNRQGISLSEIIVTIIIISILASIALPQYAITLERSRSAEGVQILEALLAAQRLYKYENPGTYATDPNDLDIDIPGLRYFNVPTVDNGDLTSPVAAIERDHASMDYTLEINEAGTIRCDYSGSVAGLCTKIGFSPTAF